jgi:hypothetical protein
VAADHAGVGRREAGGGRPVLDQHAEAADLDAPGRPIRRGPGRDHLFVNGKSEDTAEHTDPWNATGPAQIARSWYNGAWADRFAGSIADVRAYQAALPAAEISAISKLRPLTP